MAPADVDVTDELTSAHGQDSRMSVNRQTIISAHESQTEFITQAAGEMNLCDEAGLELTEESQLPRQNWPGCKSEYWIRSDPDATAVTKKIEQVAKAKARHEHDLELFFDHRTLGVSPSGYAHAKTEKRTLAPGAHAVPPSRHVLPNVLKMAQTRRFEPEHHQFSSRSPQNSVTCSLRYVLQF